jgi:hypothetical protein
MSARRHFAEAKDSSSRKERARAGLHFLPHAVPYRNDSVAESVEKSRAASANVGAPTFFNRRPEISWARKQDERHPVAQAFEA